MEMTEKPLMMMTRAEIKNLIRELAAELKPATETATIQRPSDPFTPRLAVGWIGLAKAWGVTVNTAKARYETGAFNDACKWIDGKLVVNTELAAELWTKHLQEQRAEREKRIRDKH